MLFEKQLKMSWKHRKRLTFRTIKNGKRKWKRQNAPITPTRFCSLRMRKRIDFSKRKKNKSIHQFHARLLFKIFWYCVTSTWLVNYTISITIIQFVCMLFFFGFYFGSLPLRLFYSVNAVPQLIWCLWLCLICKWLIPIALYVFWFDLNFQPSVKECSVYKCIA